MQDLSTSGRLYFIVIDCIKTVYDKNRFIANQTSVNPNTHALLLLGRSPLKREVRMRHILSSQERKELVTHFTRCSVT